MKGNVESNKAQQELCFKSEKIFMEKLSKLLEECKAEELDVGTVLDQLLYQSLSLVFRVSHTLDDAVDIIKINVDQLLEEHIPGDSENLPLVNSKKTHHIH